MAASETSTWEVVAAVSTAAAAIIALAAFWAPRWFKPKLKLELADKGGYQQKVLVEFDGKRRHGEARYFHLRVTNKVRHPKATNVQVVCLHVEDWVNGEYVTRWRGGNGIPLPWQHDGERPVRARGVGTDVYVDLCDFLQGQPPEHDRCKWMRLHLTVQPVGVDLVRREPCKVRLTLQAQSDEADSDELRVLLNWDGRWHPDGMQVREL